MEKIREFVKFRMAAVILTVFVACANISNDRVMGDKGIASSFYTGGLYTPSGLRGYADLHVHEFTNLALGGKWLYGRAWPDGTNGFSLPSTRAQMQTAIPRCSGNVPGASGGAHGALDLGKAYTFFGVGLVAGIAINELWGADTGLHAGRRHGVCQLNTVLGVGYCRGYGGPNGGCIALTHSQCTTGVQSPCSMDSWANLCRDKEGDGFSVGGVCNLIGSGNCENTCWKGNVFCRGNTACSAISRSNCPSSNVCTWRAAGNLCRDRSGDGIDAGLACNTNGGNNTDCARPCYWDPNVIIGHAEDPTHDFTDRHTNNSIDHASWPSWDSVAHQQVYVDWLKQAYDGGLRLMIMSALNNETLCNLLPNGTPCDDPTSISAQIAEAKAMDQVGAYRFYEIVYTAAQARATIAAGRMAVILSVEASDIFNGNDPISTLVGLYDNGVRTLQPMHQFNSRLGGVAFHDEVIAAMQTIKNIKRGDFNRLCKSYGGNRSYAPCNAKIGNINYKGLTAAGKSFIIKMMQLGMPIDISHMSEKSIADAQTLTTGTCNYPVYVSHGHVRDLLEPGSDFPSSTKYGWKAKSSHEKTVPDWVLNYVSNSGGLFGLRTGADYYDFPTYQQYLTLAGLGSAPIPSKGSVPMNGHSDKRGGTEYHFAYAVDYLTRVKNVNVALGSDFNGMIEQMLFDNENSLYCPGSSAIDTQDCKMAGMAHIGKENALMNQKLNATGLQNVSSYNSLRNNSADAYVQMWERSTSIAAGNCCNPITVSQLETTTAHNGATAWITIDGTGFNALTTMSAKLRVYQGTAEYACTGFQMISSTQAACLVPAGLPVGFYDVIVSNESGYCNQSGVRTKAILMTSSCVSITLNPAAGALPAPVINTFYDQAFTATGGCASSFTYSLTSGALPIGLTLDADGELSGTATQPGVFTFTVTATDSCGCSQSQTYTLTANVRRGGFTFTRGINEFCISGGGSFNSPTQTDNPNSPFLVGNTGGVRYGSIGLCYGRILSANDKVAFKYTFDGTPVGVISYPDVDPNNFVNTRRNVFGAGLSPIGFQLYFRPQSRVKPFVNTSGGFFFFKDPVPRLNGAQFNFTFDFGGGVQVFRDSRRAFTFGYKYQHLSNGGRALNNLGFDGSVFYFGYSIFKAKQIGDGGRISQGSGP